VFELMSTAFELFLPDECANYVRQHHPTPPNYMKIEPT
jgi:hypothetical protein